MQEQLSQSKEAHCSLKNEIARATLFDDKWNLYQITGIP